MTELLKWRVAAKNSLFTVNEKKRNQNKDVLKAENKECEPCVLLLRL